MPKNHQKNSDSPEINIATINFSYANLVPNES